jgi:hypothetical protein
MNELTKRETRGVGERSKKIFEQVFEGVDFEAQKKRFYL